jgi:hypothetical protein
MYYLVGTEENCTNEDPLDFHSPPNIMRVIITRRMRSARHVLQVARIERVLVGKPEGIRPLGTAGRRWEDNIKMDLKRYRLGWRALIWIRIETSGGLL